MLKKEEVKHIAKLARLGLDKKEIEKFQKELSSILDYIEKLREVDILKVEATSHPLSVENVIRKDEARGKDLKRAGRLVEMAPEHKQGYVKTKSIL